MSARDLVGWFIWRLGLAALARRLLVNGGRFALNFHGVSSRRRADISSDLQPHHSAIEFRQTLLWLKDHFAFLTVEQFLETDQPGVLLTFDDGHANNLSNILPILADFQAEGVFFVSTQHVLEPRNWLPASRRDARSGWGNEQSVPDEIARDFFDGLSPAELKALADSPWAVIGSHTVSHPSLPTCTPEQIAFELNQSRKDLQEISRQAVDLFAYPYGDYNLPVARAVCQAGYRAAFAVDPLPVHLPAYEIPRIGVYAAKPAYLSLKMSGLHRRALRGPILARNVSG